MVYCTKVQGASEVEDLLRVDDSDGMFVFGASSIDSRPVDW